MSELMTTREASEYLQLSYMTLYKLAQQGQIPAYKIGGHWRFNKTALDEWFAGKSMVVEYNVLVIGDDADAADIKKIISDQNRFRVTAARNLEQAMRELEKREYVLIFFASMRQYPESTETISAIRNKARGSIVAIGTGRDDEPISLDATSTGPLFIIPKPFKKDDILKILGTVDSHVTEGESRTKDTLISELLELRQRIDELSVADSERRKMEAALNFSEEKLLRFMEFSSDIFLLLDAKFNIVDANKAVQRYMPPGSKLKDFIGMNILELLPGIKGSGRYEKYLDVLKTGKPVEFDEIVIDSRLGEATVSLKAFKLRDGLLIIATDVTELKLMDALKESEEFSSGLLDNAPNPILVAGADTSIIYVNPALEQLTGFSLAELAGLKTPYPYSTDDAIQQINGLIESALLDRPQNDEMLLKKKNGELFCIEATTKVVKKNGVPEYFISIWADITERKRAEQELIESEGKYRALVEQSLQGIVIIQDGCIVFSNNALAERGGYTVDELLSFSQEEVTQLVHPDDRAMVWGRMWDRLSGKQVPNNYEFRLIGKDGEVFWAELFSNVVEYRGKPAVQVTLSDITQRKKVEEALRESEEKYRNLFEHTLVGMEVIDADTGKIVFANRSMSVMFGFKSPEDMIGIDAVSYVLPEDREWVLRELAQVIADPHKLDLATVRSGTEDGRIIWVTASATSFEHEGKTTVILSMVEVTAAKEAEEALLREKNFSDSTINSLPGVFYMIDAEGRFVRWNKNLEIESEYTAEELSELNPLELFDEKDRPLVQQGIEKTFSEGKDSIEADAVTKSGRVVPYYLTGSLITLNDKAYLAGVGIEVSERKRIQEQLRESEERLKTFMENAPDAIFIHDVYGNMIQVNRKAEEMLGFSRDELIGKNVFDLGLIDEKYIPEILEGLERSKKGEGGGPIVIEMSTKDGSRIRVEASGYPVNTRGYIEVLDIVRDITGRGK